MSASFVAAVKQRSHDVGRGAHTPPDLQSVLHVDLLLDLVARHLALMMLSFLQRAAGATLLPMLRRACAARRGVTAADVDADVHVCVLRHLIASSALEVITLAPGVYDLGSVANPLHVQLVRPEKPPFDELCGDRVGEWLDYAPEWRRGYGPLELRRSVVLRGKTASGRIGERSHERPRLSFLDAPRKAGALVEAGAGPLRVTLQGIDFYSCAEPLSCFYLGEHFRADFHGALFVSTGGCRRCATPASRLGATCTCERFGGPTLEVTDCFIHGGFSLIGRSAFERCTFRMDEEYTVFDVSGRPVPWHPMRLSETRPWGYRGTTFEQMNNVQCESFGDRTVTREPNVKFSIICTCTSKAPGSESLVVEHEFFCNSWETPHPVAEAELVREGPRPRFDDHELRGPPEEADLALWHAWRCARYVDMRRYHRVRYDCNHERSRAHTISRRLSIYKKSK